MKSLDELEIIEQPLFKLKPRVLDSVVGKIMLPSQISVFHGESRFPLTAIAHTIATAACKSGKETIFIDSGTNFNPQLIHEKSMEEKKSLLARIKVGHPLEMQDLELVFGQQALENTSLIVIDSLTGLLNLSTSPGTKERQRQLFQTLEFLREIVNESKTHLLMTDHSSRNWRTGQSKPLGGNVIEHAVDSIVRLTNIENIPDTVQVSVDRTPIIPNPGGVVLRIDHRGIRSIKSI